MRIAIAIIILIAASINWLSIPIKEKPWDYVVETRIDEVPDIPNEQYQRSIREDVTNLVKSVRWKRQARYNALFYNALFLTVIGALLLTSEVITRIRSNGRVVS